ncbi:MAG: hypothetical protein SFV19_03405 [Rhodospirillaceae bacterium]|nr:hypothetical protein [Rhodospirillaceae bacterium]
MLASWSGPSIAAARQNFMLINATGYTISEVYVSPSKTADWEEDVLGLDVLADGERTEIRFSRSENSCLWDLKVAYDDGESAEWVAIDLCEVSVVAITYDDRTGETSATVE